MAVSYAVRVRIAPSPTGFAHLGTASTALYNVLFARRRDGAFVLRIDDTDLERNRPEYEQLIYETLHWLALDLDEGPDRGGPHAPFRQSQLEKRPYKYSRRGLTNPPTGREVFAVRFKVPGGDIEFTDMVRGEMHFDGDLIGDFIIIKSDTYPTYQFASPVDDAVMKITHVIRGEEHLSNTPYQLMLIDSLGYERPQAYAHMPLILASDGSKLSKRKHPETNLVLFREQGYLPEALVNYLALLGWNPGTEQEIFTFDELLQAFSFDRVQHGGARFDWDKLNWLNGEYIRRLSDDELARRLKDFVPLVDEETLRRAVPALKTRLHRLGEAVDYLDYIWKDPSPPALDPETSHRVRAALDALRATQWEPEPIESALERAVQESGVSKGKFYTPLRDVLTGKKVALPIHYAFALLPKEKALSRLEGAA